MTVPRRTVVLVAIVSLLVMCGSTSRASRSPTLQQLIGQKLVVRMDGKTPSPSLEDGLKTQQVLDAIATSAADRGHWVEVAR